MALDPVLNFGKVTVSTGYDAAATSIVLETGHGAKLPDPASVGAFNVTWWNSTDYPDPSDDPNVEIVRVTGRSTDTLTVTRAQESTSASTKNTAAKVYKMVLSATKKMIDDIDDAIDLRALDSAVVHDTGNETIAGVKTFSSDPLIPDEAYGVGWDNSLEPPTKNAVYDKIQSATATGQTFNETPGGTINGSNTTFTLVAAPITGSLLLYLNGQRLTYTDDYTLSGSTITMVVAPMTGDILRADYQLNTGTFATGSTSFVYNETPSGTVNGTNAVFDTAGAYVAGTIQVYRDGQLMKGGGADYTETDSNTITFVTAPTTGSVLLVHYQSATSTAGNADTLDGQHAPTGTIVGTTDTQTLSNKTLTSPVINTQITGTAIATGAEITTGTNDTKIVTPKALADATVSKLGGAWTSFVPSWTNLTVGAGGTNTGAYTQIGKTVHLRTYFKFGSGSSVGTTPILTLPVSINSGYTSNLAIIGGVTCLDDNTGGTYYGVLDGFGAARLHRTDGTYSSQGGITATVPFTWTTNDLLLLTATYESA